MEQRGLDRHSHENWYDVEGSTSTYLMSYLTSVLARKLDLLPATDMKMNRGVSKIYDQQFGGRSNKRREKVLEGIIPFPRELDLAKVVRLKDKYGKLLSHFQSVIEQIALDAKYNDDGLLNEKIKELNFQKAEISARISEDGLGPIIYGTSLV